MARLGGAQASRAGTEQVPGSAPWPSPERTVLPGQSPRLPHGRPASEQEAAGHPRCVVTARSGTPTGNGPRRLAVCVCSRTRPSSAAVFSSTTELVPSFLRRAVCIHTCTARTAHTLPVWPASSCGSHPPHDLGVRSGDANVPCFSPAPVFGRLRRRVRPSPPLPRAQKCSGSPCACCSTLSRGPSPPF